MTFAQRRNRLTTHFSEIIPVVKRRMTVLEDMTQDTAGNRDQLKCDGTRSETRFRLSRETDESI